MSCAIEIEMIATVTTPTTTYTVEVTTDKMAREWRRKGLDYLDMTEVAAKLDMHKTTIVYAHAVIRDLSVWKQYMTFFKKTTPKTDEYILRALELMANTQLALERDTAAQKAAADDALNESIKKEFEKLEASL
jgi:hypothetical protein